MDSSQRLQQIIEYELPYMKALGMKGEIRNAEVIAEFDDGPCEVILPRTLYFERILRGTDYYSDIINGESYKMCTIDDRLMGKWTLFNDRPLYHILAHAANVEKFGCSIEVYRNQGDRNVTLFSFDINVHLIFQPQSGLAHYFLMPSRKLAESEPERVLPNEGPYR